MKIDKTESVTFSPLKSQEDLKDGDVFLWRSGQHGHYEVHTFQSDSGYGVKTYTEYNEKEGSSLLVNWSGVCGKLVTPNPS